MNISDDITFELIINNFYNNLIDKFIFCSFDHTNYNCYFFAFRIFVQLFSPSLPILYDLNLDRKERRSKRTKPKRLKQSKNRIIKKNIAKSSKPYLS